MPPVGSVFGFLIKAYSLVAAPIVKRLRPLIAERRALESGSARVPDPLRDGLVATLNRLRSSQQHDPGAFITRTEPFNKPAIRDWLSDPAVEDALLRLVTDRIKGLDRDDTQYIDAVLAKWEQHTGERREIGARMLASLTSALIAGHSSRLDDSTKLIASRISDIQRQMEEQGSAAGAVGSAPYLDADTRLRAALRVRAIDRTEAQRRISVLAADVLTGHLTGLPAQVRGCILSWAARLTLGAGGGEDTAEEFRRAARPLLDREKAAALEAVFIAHGKDYQRALAELQPFSSPDTTSLKFFFIRELHGAEAAIDWASSNSIDPSKSMTGTGLRNFAVTLTLLGRFSEAADWLDRATPEQIADCPQISMVRSIIFAAQVLPPQYRTVELEAEALSSDMPVANNAEAQANLRIALDCMKRARLDCADLGHDGYARALEKWEFALSLLHLETREDARARLGEMVRDDVKSAVSYFRIALDYKVPMPLAEIKAYLDLQLKLKLISGSEFAAMLAYLRAYGPKEELVRFLEENATELDPLMEDGRHRIAILIETLMELGRHDEASEQLRTSRANLPADLAERIDISIQSAAGTDVLPLLRKRYEESHDDVDRSNLIRGLGASKLWDQLIPLARAQFEDNQNVDSAGRVADAYSKNSDWPGCLAFLKTLDTELMRDPELRRQLSRAQFNQGQLANAFVTGEGLLDQNPSVRDFLFAATVLVYLGRWEELPALVRKARGALQAITGGDQVRFAYYVSAQDRALALDLIKAAANSTPDDPHVLAGCHFLSVMLGAEDQAGDWLERAIGLSGSDGPLTAVPMKGVLEIHQQEVERTDELRRALGSGSIPIHMAAAMTNAALMDLIYFRSQVNQREPDRRRISMIPLWSGARGQSVPVPKRAALDITSAILLQSLGLLEKALDYLGSAHFSPRLLAVLWQEAERIRFIQPSRLTTAEAILRFEKFPAVTVISRRAGGDVPMAIEVGRELADLLAYVSEHGGNVIHPGQVSKIGSLGEERASLGEHATRVFGAQRLLDWLGQTGRVPAHLLTKVRSHAIRADERAPEGSGLDPATRMIAFDGLALTYLAQWEVLDQLDLRDLTVVIHEEAISDARELLENTDLRQRLAADLDALRLILTARLRADPGATLAFSDDRDDEREEREVVSSLLDILGSAGQVEAGIMDDRCVNANATLMDNLGRSAQLVTSFDLMSQMVSDGAMSTSEFYECLRRARLSGILLVPITFDELRNVLLAAPTIDGSLRETPELFAIRTYLAWVRGLAGVLGGNEAGYVDRTFTAAIQVLRDIWFDRNVVDAERTPRATWLFHHVLPFWIDWHHVYSPTAIAHPAEELTAGQIARLSMLASDDGRMQLQYRDWLNAEFQRFNDRILRLSARIWAQEVTRLVSDG